MAFVDSTTGCDRLFWLSCRMTQSYVKALGGPHAARNLLSQQVGETQMPTLLA